jgi:putative FmdB family regulatory protein
MAPVVYYSNKERRQMPLYEFDCPNCNHREAISCSMSQIKDEHPLCPFCNVPLVRVWSLTGHTWSKYSNPREK